MSKNDQLKEFMSYWGKPENSYRLNQIVPVAGDFVILASDDWRIFDGSTWRAMTTEEQLEASK